MEKARLMIAVPTLDYMHWRFVDSLIKLSNHLDDIGIEHDVVFKHSTLLYLGRNELAAKAVDECYTHVLWIDADMVFEPEAFDILYNSGKEFICGLFRGRHNNKRCYSLFSELRPPTRYEALDTCPELLDDILSIKGCGFAFVLMTTLLLKQLKERQGPNFFTPITDYSEDLSFCIRALDLGYDIYCEPRAKIGHIGHGIIKPDKTIELV